MDWVQLEFHYPTGNHGLLDKRWLAREAAAGTRLHSCAAPLYLVAEAISPRAVTDLTTPSASITQSLPPYGVQIPGVVVIGVRFSVRFGRFMELT